MDKARQSGGDTKTGASAAPPDAASSKSRFKTPEEKAEAARAANAALRKELDDYLKKSPAEHMREAILARMGLSEESLKAMPPEQRAAVEAEINRQITECLLSREKKDAPEQPAAALQKSVAGVSLLGNDAQARSPEGMAVFVALQAWLAGGGKVS